MKKLYVFMATIFLSAIVACSGGGGGGNSNSSDTASGTKSTISGDISAPSGIVPSSLTIVSLDKETSVSSQGNFSADVYKDGVAVVAAMPEGKSFGLINVVVTNSTKSSDNIVAASMTKGTKGSGVKLDAQTTAVSLVFLSPYFITNDPTATSTLLPIIESDPKVAMLATVIEDVFSSADPLNEPSFQQALIDAVQSVINTLATQNKSVAVSETASSSVKILQVPKVSTFKSLMKAASLSPTTYYADQDYITVKAETSATGYGVTVESRNVGSIDWIAETMKLDSTQFTSFVDFQAKASNKRNVYNNERQDVLGKLNAPAKSVFRYFDLIQVAFDYAFEYSFGAKALDQIPVSSTEDGVYLIRSYSGSIGRIIDKDELSFVKSNVLNGKDMNNAALATNVLMVGLDTISIFLDIKSMNLDTVVKAGMKAFQDEVSLVNNPTMNDLMDISASVMKAMVEKGSVTLVKQGFLEMFVKSTKIVVRVIDVPAKLSTIGKVADRLLQMFTSGTPMETSYVVVGNPFPSSYAVSGRVTYNSAGLAGVKVTITGDSSISTQTGSDGSYTFNLAHGSHTLTPSLSGYTFSPTNVAVTVNYNDKTIPDIIATKDTTTPTVAMTPMSVKPGETVTEWGTGFTPNSTATLHFSKPDSTEFTPLSQAIKSDGTFSITYTIPTDRTPGTYAWWGVDSAGKVSNIVSFTIATATPSTGYTISGRVTLNGNGLAGITVTLTGAGSSSTITDANGSFTFINAANGSYILSFSGSGYTFSPSSVNVIVNGGNYSITTDIVATIQSSSGLWNGTQKIVSSKNAFVKDTAVDANGNIYLTGHTTGDMDGNTSMGGADMFLVKYNSSGTKQWTRQLGTSETEWGNSVAVDLNGNVYVTGREYGNLDGNTNAGGEDFFLVKYNTSGIKQWTRQLGTSYNEESYCVATDASGNVYVTGSTYGNLDGNSSAGYTGKSDMFLVKYNSSGTKQWVRQLFSTTSAAGWASGKGVVVDSGRNIYVTGTIYSHPDDNTYIQDIFLVKYDNNGTKQWTEVFGTSFTDVSTDVTVDTNGDIYVVGEANERIDSSEKDILVAKYNSSGTQQWTRQFGSSHDAGMWDDDAGGVAVDNSGNVYVVGGTYGNLDGYTNAGSEKWSLGTYDSDMFIVKYNSSGTKQWTRQWGSEYSEGAYGVAVDHVGNVYVAAIARRSDLDDAPVDSILMMFDSDGIMH